MRVAAVLLALVVVVADARWGRRDHEKDLGRLENILKECGQGLKDCVTDETGEIDRSSIRTCLKDFDAETASEACKDALPMGGKAKGMGGKFKDMAGKFMGRAKSLGKDKMEGEDGGKMAKGWGRFKAGWGAMKENMAERKAGVKENCAAELEACGWTEDVEDMEPVKECMVADGTEISAKCQPHLDRMAEKMTKKAEWAEKKAEWVEAKEEWVEAKEQLEAECASELAACAENDTKKFKCLKAEDAELSEGCQAAMDAIEDMKEDMKEDFAEKGKIGGGMRAKLKAGNRRPKVGKRLQNKIGKRWGNRS